MQNTIQSIILTSVFVLLSTFFQINPAGADGPYRGKVIDAETKEPIEGAVVLGVWRKRELFSFHPDFIFEEAKEVLTDKVGAFTLPGHVMSTSILDPTSRNQIRIYIYKPGYGSFPKFQISPNPKQSYAKLLKPFETHGLVALPKLKKRKQRLRNIKCPGYDIPDDKLTNFIEAMRKEYVKLGSDSKVVCFDKKFQ